MLQRMGLMFFVGTGLLVILGLYAILKTKKLYEKGRTLTSEVTLSYWILDAAHFLLVILSSSYSIGTVQIDKIAACVVGVGSSGFGLALMASGMVEFWSIGMISGLDNSKLVTTGVYRWSRNPQYAGWLLILVGTSIVGRSGLALLYSVIGGLLFHFYVTRLEEPHLERLFGKKYLSYKKRVPRYFGVPKRD